MTGPVPHTTQRISERELLLNSFWNRPVSRRPISPFVYRNFVKAFLGNQNVDMLQGTIDVYRHFGFDLMHRNINVRLDDVAIDGPNWKVAVEETQDGANILTKTIIRTPERKLTRVTKTQELTAFHQVSAIVEFFIKDRDDFEQFVKYQPPVPKSPLTELKRAKELIGDEGVTAPWISGVFNFLADFRKLDDLLMDALLDKGFYQDMVDYFLERLIVQVQNVLDEGVDILSYGGNVANGSIVGPGFFESHILPYERRLIDLIQRQRTAVLYHNCGDARSMIEVYNQLGIAAYESMAEPPYGDNDLADCLSRFDQSITLVGNLDQITFLRKSNPEDIRNRALSILRLADDRESFILGTTDFLEEDTPHANLFAILGMGC